MADLVQGTIPDGEYVIGRFGGMVGERYPKLRVLQTRDGDDGPVVSERDLEVNGYRPELFQQIEALEKGDQIAVAVFVGARGFTYKKDGSHGSRTWRAGDRGEMPTYEVRSVTVLASA